MSEDSPAYGVKPEKPSGPHQGPPRVSPPEPPPSATVRAASDRDPGRPFTRHETALIFDGALRRAIRKALRGEVSNIIRNETFRVLLADLSDLTERVELLEACVDKHDRIAREALQLFQDERIENSEFESEVGERPDDAHPGERVTDGKEY